MPSGVFGPGPLPVFARPWPDLLTPAPRHVRRPRYALFAEILRDLAKTASSMASNDTAHQGTLRDAAKALYLALEAGACGGKDADPISKMTPEEEVLLLHIME